MFRRWHTFYSDSSVKNFLASKTKSLCHVPCHTNCVSEYFRVVSKGAATGNQGRSSSSISSPWSLQVRLWILFCSFLVRKIIFNYFNAKFVIFQQFWCMKFWENCWGPETAGFTLAMPWLCLWHTLAFDFDFVVPWSMRRDFDEVNDECFAYSLVRIRNFMTIT